MLIDFSVKNYLSFKDEQVLSLVASADKSLLDNTILDETTWGTRLLRSLVIYGPNASGKSNLLNAFSFVTQFVVNSLDRRDEYNFRNRSFLLSNQTRGGKSEFEIHFIHKGTRYRFGISLDEERVYDEYLIAYPKGHPQVWYERTSSENTDKSNWKFGYYLKGEKQKLVSVTPPNVLFLSVANKFDHEQLSDVYEWFDYYVRVISPHIGVDQALLNFSASQCFEDKDLRKSIVKLLWVADTENHRY